MDTENIMDTTQGAVSNEKDRQSNAPLSRAGFLRMGAVSVLGAAGALLSASRPVLAASDSTRTTGIAHGRKVVSGLYYIQSALTGYVLDIPNSNRAAGTHVSVYPQNSPFSYNQVWFVSEDGYIQSVLDGFVLDVVYGNKNPGASVALYPKNYPPSPNQNWFISNGYIYTALDGMVLDINGSNTAPGASIIVYPKNYPASANQQWILISVF